MDESKYYVSYQGQGVDGWKKHIKIRLVEVDYFPWPTQYNCENGDENFATGECLDVTSGLFAPEVWDIVQPYIKDDGTYPTGICEDYDGNWMLRRCLKTDAEGNEYIAEGVVSNEGLILQPIRVRVCRYDQHKVYPLTGSWDDVRKVASQATRPPTSQYSFHHSEAGYVNLIVPLSFFEDSEEYSDRRFGEMSSRTFYTGVYFQDDGKILLKCLSGSGVVYNEAGEIDDDEYIFQTALLSADGTILEPLSDPPDFR